MFVLIGAQIYQLLVPALSFFTAAGVAVVLLGERNRRLRVAEESFAHDLVSRHFFLVSLYDLGSVEFNRKLRMLRMCAAILLRQKRWIASWRLLVSRMQLDSSHYGARGLLCACYKINHIRSTRLNSFFPFRIFTFLYYMLESLQNVAAIIHN